MPVAARQPSLLPSIPLPNRCFWVKKRSWRKGGDQHPPFILLSRQGLLCQAGNGDHTERSLLLTRSCLNSCRDKKLLRGASVFRQLRCLFPTSVHLVAIPQPPALLAEKSRQREGKLNSGWGAASSPMNLHPGKKQRQLPPLLLGAAV